MIKLNKINEVLACGRKIHEESIHVMHYSDIKGKDVFFAIICSRSHLEDINNLFGGTEADKTYLLEGPCRISWFPIGFGDTTISALIELEKKLWNIDIKDYDQYNALVYGIHLMIENRLDFSGIFNIEHNNWFLDYDKVVEDVLNPDEDGSEYWDLFLSLPIKGIEWKY